MSQSKGEQVVQNWRDNVKQVKTMSALHTLLGILENSVKWDKSAENAVSIVMALINRSILRFKIILGFLVGESELITRFHSQKYRLLIFS